MYTVHTSRKKILASRKQQLKKSTACQGGDIINNVLRTVIRVCLSSNITD